MEIVDVVPVFEGVSVPTGPPIAFDQSRPFGSIDLWSDSAELTEEWRESLVHLHELPALSSVAEEGQLDSVALGTSFDLSGLGDTTLFVREWEVHYDAGDGVQVLVSRTGFVLCPIGTEERTCGAAEAEDFFGA